LNDLAISHEWQKTLIHLHTNIIYEHQYSVPHFFEKSHFDFVIGQVPSGVSAMPVGSHVNQHIPKLHDWSYSKANGNLPG